MAKKLAAAEVSPVVEDKANLLRPVPKGFRRIERKLRPFWIPQDRDEYPANCVRTKVIEGIVVGTRVLKGKWNDQEVMDLDTADGFGASIVINGNLPYLIKDASLDVGETIRVEYLRFIKPCEKYPMGRHEYDLLVAVTGE